VTRTVDERLHDIVEAIAHARVADKRLQLAQSLGDEAGVQIAFESFLHNLFVIREAVRALPPEILDREPKIPWGGIAAMHDVIGHHHRRIDPAIVHGAVEADLDPLEAAVKRLRRHR
jgi:uncharacterized protein with HEPN domain